MIIVSIISLLVQNTLELSFQETNAALLGIIQKEFLTFILALKYTRLYGHYMSRYQLVIHV